jgi:DNA polymerase
MGLNTLDVETYYDQNYTLKKMTTEEYINDPRFELLMVGLHTHDDQLVVEDTADLADHQIRDMLMDYQCDRHVMAGHNMMFDGALLNWRYGVKAPMYVDTMLMLRAKYRHEIGSCSLANAAKHFGIGEKGDAILDAKGKHRPDFTDEEWAKFREYCQGDANLTQIMVDLILPDFPREELKIINRTLRWYIDPVLELDIELLSDAVIRENMERQALFKSSGLDETTLASSEKFAQWLLSQGVNPPQKRSPRTNKLIYAFAKSDPEFLQLKHHASHVVRTAVEARIRTKSRIKETRMERFVGIAERNAGKLPVPLLYSGARTHRFAGLEKINLQNLTHGDECRGGIVAPDGHKIVAADQSQIEARINAVLSGQWDLVERFRQGVDNYSWLAEKIYGFPVKKPMEERKVGKATFLGCGYGMGHERFFDYMASKELKVPVSKLDAENIIGVYRNAFPKIRQHWYFCAELLKYCAGGGTYQHGPVTVGLEHILLPSGLRLHYPQLHQTGDGYQYRHWSGGRWEWARLYGPKLTENIVQALARQLLCEQQNILEKRYRTVHQVHDELLFVVPDEQVPEAMAVMERVMAVPPKWMPNLPLEAEVAAGQNFGECK